MKKISLELNSVNLISYALYRDYHLPKELGINLTQERILMTIKNSVNFSMVQIARQIGLEKGPFSQSIDILEKLVLVKRIRSSTDKRSIHLNLTEKGKLLTNMIQKNMDNHFNNVLSSLSEKEKTDLFNSLNTIQKTADILLKVKHE